MSLVVDGRVRRGDVTIEPSLRVDRGEIVAIAGPNGAGKSTALHVLAGLVRLDDGLVEIDGVAWDDGRAVAPAAERSVGAVFQDYRLFGHLSVLENVAFGLRARGTDRATARRDAAAALERLGVRELAGRLPGDLSGGQAQRVAMARAIVVRREVLLLDEPFAALDVSARGAIRHELERWLAEVDAYRIIVTHDPVDAHAFADRVVVMEDGLVTQHGSMSDLAAAPRSRYVADLIGTNFLRGRLDDGALQLEGSDLTLSVGAHDAPDGPVIATVRPAAIALHRLEPEGTPRNVWATTVEGVDTSDGRVRVRLGAPLRLVVEVTGAGFGALDVGVGGRVWASVKASEIDVVADA